MDRVKRMIEGHKYNNKYKWPIHTYHLPLSKKYNFPTKLNDALKSILQNNQFNNEISDKEETALWNGISSV